MAKVKNKRSNNSKQQSNKKNTKPKKLNPFEVHINKEKLKVLNRKQKHVKGTPGISRSKAISKRKNTLLQEYKVHKKSNKFTDMRIGERDPNMPEEHRIIARYTAEKVKSHKRKSIFNLADDEVLTHKGQLLTEIEKFENEASDDEEEDNNLQANFVKEAHFGGGLFHKVSSDGAKTHKDLINQLILESKKRKNERLKLKEQTLELTEKLDTEWKDLLPLVNNSRKKAADPEIIATQDKPKNDDYDKVMRQLKFEARGNPSDRLRSEEEIERKEKEELENFEKEREKRMRGGDDLEDNFMLETIEDDEADSNEESEDESEEIDPKPNLNMENENLSPNKIASDGINMSNEETLQSVDEEMEGSDVEEQNDEEVNSEDESADEDVDNEENGDDNSDEDDAISLSDLKADASESSASEDEMEHEIVGDIIKTTEKDTSTANKIIEECNEKLSIEVCFPDCYSTLERTFEYAKPEKLGILLSKLIQLIAGNKEKSHTLFSYILQYIDSTYCSFKKLAYLLPHIFQLAKVNPEKCYASVREYLKEKQKCYRSKPKKYPSFSILLVLKVISALYTTSDFRHGVVTPAFVFISQMLTCCRVRTRQDISYGLFLVTLVLEYTALSKRFLPAAVRFLTGIIHMTIPKTSVRLIKIPPPFKYTSTLLVLQQNMLDYSSDLTLQESDLKTPNSMSPIFQISALSLAVKLITEMAENCKEFSSNCELFHQTLQFLKLLPLDNYPTNVQKKIGTLIKSLEDNELNRKLEYITAPKKKPKLLRLYEPNIEKVYDGKKHKGKSREKMERDKMLHKIKRETKGAMREIRKDKSFLGRFQINQRIQSDEVRREKVRKIYAEAASQQAELNSLDRKKRKR